MGMFDWVEYEMKCPNCGEELRYFQTKDLKCELRYVKPTSKLDNFYMECPRCKAWIELDRYKDSNLFKGTITLHKKGYRTLGVVKRFEKIIKEREE